MILREYDFTKKLIQLSIIAGSLLALLHPIGLLVSIKGVLFQSVFIAHLIAHLAVTALAAICLWRLMIGGSISKIIPAGALLLLTALIVLNCLPPVTVRDALIHHLAVPKWWIQANRIYEIPWHEWSYFPMLLDLGFTGFLSWGWEEATALYHFSFLFILTALAGEFVRERMERERADFAIFAALLALSLPMSLRLALSPLVDLGLALYIGIALVALTRWVEVHVPRIQEDKELEESESSKGHPLSSHNMSFRTRAEREGDGKSLPSAPLEALSPNSYFFLSVLRVLCGEYNIQFNHKGRKGHQGKNIWEFGDTPLEGGSRAWRGGGCYYALAAGLSLGFALSTKYNGLLAAVLLAPTTLLFALRSELKAKTVILGAISVSLSALIAYSSWIITNAAWTGNPIFPMYNGYFGIESVPNAFQGPRPMQLRIEYYKESLLDLLLLPLRMVLFGEDDNPVAFDGKLTPVLLLLFLPFVRWNKGKWKILFCCFTLLYFLFALLMSGARMRYLAPLLFPAVVLTAAGAQQLFGFLSTKKRRAAIAFLVVLQIVLGGNYLLRLTIENETLQYLFTSQSREEYLREKASFYLVASELSQSLPKESVVFLIYTPNYFYYFDIGVRGNYDSGFKILSWAKHSKSYDEFSAYLDQLEITHMLVHTRRLSEFFAQNIDVLPPEKREFWNRYRRERLKVLRNLPHLQLFEVIQPG